MLHAKDIMSSPVITVTKETSVKELAKMFMEKNISGVVVLDAQGDVAGVVTESDLIDQRKKVHIPTVMAILDSFVFLESTEKMEHDMKKMAGATVGDICSDKITSVGPDTPLDEIATLMSEKQIHTLPVLDQGSLVGVIGKTDIIRTLIQE